MVLYDALYSEWYVFLIALAIGSLPIILCLKIIPEPKRFLYWFIRIIFVCILLFYFFVPVPLSEQGKYVATVQNFKNSNTLVGFNNIARMKERYCSLPYLSGIGYFQLLSAYRQDFKIIIKEQGTIPESAPDTPQVFVEQKICDVDLS